MDNIMRICGISLCAAALTLLIKQTRPEYAPAVTAAASVMLFISAVTVLSPSMEVLRSLSEGTGYGEYTEVIFKGLGITLAASSTADLCRDMGESSLGSKIELMAKAEILLLSLPLLERMIRLCTGLLAS